MDAVDDGGKGDASAGMGLGIEKDLRVAHALTPCRLQIGVGEIVEVLLMQQYGHALVVEIQERLQVFEFVGVAQLLERRVGKGHPISLGQFDHHLRLERPFDMEVQLRFRQPLDEAARITHLLRLLPLV